MTRRFFRRNLLRSSLGLGALLLGGARWTAFAQQANGGPTRDTQGQREPTEPPELPELPEFRRLVAANRILAREGVVDAFGHVSVRDPRDPQRFVMSRSRSPALVELADLMEFRLDGSPVDARGRTAYGERMIHAAVYLQVDAQVLLEAQRLGEAKSLSPGEIEKSSEAQFSPLALDRAWEYFCQRAGVDAV
jgi:hypothetical protein